MFLTTWLHYSTVNWDSRDNEIKLHCSEKGKVKNEYVAFKIYFQHPLLGSRSDAQSTRCSLYPNPFHRTTARKKGTLQGLQGEMIQYPELIV